MIRKRFSYLHSHDMRISCKVSRLPSFDPTFRHGVANVANVAHVAQPWYIRFTRLFGIPSGYVKIAIENDPFIVDLPIKDGDFP